MAFRAVALSVCQWARESSSNGFQEPPDIHMHPEPMPFDYNDWNDHCGRHVIRHNYH